MSLGSADIASMLSDLHDLGDAVTVTIGAQSTFGVWDVRAAEYFGDGEPQVGGTEKSVHVQTGTLSALSSGASITVDGTAYRVRDFSPYGDGAMTRVLLES